MFKHSIAQIAMPIMYTCNLRCKYCTHYCDFGYKGEVAYAQGEEWILSWARRIEPKIFRMHGGEPLLHKDAKKYIQLCAKYFPEAKRDFVTNGLLLCKHEDLLSTLIDTDTALTISLHPLQTKQQENLMDKSLSLAISYRGKGLRLKITDSPRNWLKFYINSSGRGILPFAEKSPEKSFQNCTHSHCVQLHQGKLWQCAPLAYLPMIADQLEAKQAWEPYLCYRPLGIDASDEEIATFIRRDSKFCGMCPTEPQKVSIEGVIPRNPAMDILRAKLNNAKCKNME